MNKKINLSDISKSYSTNSDGMLLYDFMVKVITAKQHVILVIENDTAMSSSFLNSSFGEFIENFGISSLRQFFKIETSKTQFTRLKSYINKYLQLEHI